MRSKKLNIYFISLSQHFGGAERILYQVEKILSNKFATNFIVSKKIHSSFENKNKIVVDNSYKISNNKISVFYFLFYFLRIKLHEKSKNNVYYCNDLESVFTSIPLKIYYKGIIVWHIHDVYDLNKISNKILFKFLNIFVDKFICLTVSNKIRINNYINRDITVIHNFSRYLVKKSPKKYDNNYIIFGYAGQITAWKRIDLVITSFLELIKKFPEKNYCLKIVGKPYYEYDYRLFIKLRNETRDCNSIIWEDFKNDIYEFYNSIDFLISFSNNEPFGLVIVESMSFGVPVISTLGDGPCEILDKKNGILINGENNEDILSNFLKINFENLDYFQLSTNAIKTINDYFTFEKFQSNVYSFFDNL